MIEQVPTLEAQITEKRARKYGRLGSIAKLLSSFFLGHGAVQALNLITGLFLVRALSVEAYAQYSLALGFQATAMSLTSLGLTDSIVPLVGDRFADLKLVGRYVNAARNLRSRLFVIVAPACAILFHLVARTRGWGTAIELTLSSSILLSLYVNVTVACYSAPLILNRRLFDYYLGQVLAGAIRVIGCISAAGMRVLGAGSASLLGAGCLFLNALIAREKATGLMDLPKRTDRATNKEVLSCMLPVMPAIIFAAFQPQMSLFLVSIFGKTLQIAQVAALSRIAQVFLIFNMFNTIVVEPYVAKTRIEDLASTYCRFLGAAAAVATAITSLCFTFPDWVTLILGPKYKDLRGVVPWVVLASSVSTFANLIWVMNRSRRWLFWRGSFLEIACILASQSAFVITMGINTALKAALFSLVTALSILAAHSYVTMYGFRHSPTSKPVGQT
jgi:O-antigen/teichoic acid export membrane protein